MDGTGELFAEFLSYYDGDHLVLSLPQFGPQEYADLAGIINKQLPTEGYILLAESFAGGIVPELLKLNSSNMKGVIFVASFLSSPNKYLLQIAKRLPIKALASVPLSNIVYKGIFLVPGASKELLSKFVKVIKSIPEHVLKSRLAVMTHQRLPEMTFGIPAIYIRALSDRLISSQKGREFNKVFIDIEYITIEGPHFILQAKPKECSRLITEAISSLLSKGRHS